MLEGEKKNELASIIMNSISNLNKLGISTGTAKRSIRIIKNAPLAILVFNETSNYKDNHKNKCDIRNLGAYCNAEYMHTEWVNDILSIGASIENMLLASLSYGLGSLWVSDVVYAKEEICRYVKEESELISCLVIGYSDEIPLHYSRKALEEKSKWIK